MTREEFHNIVKEYSQIKLYENSEKDREFMYNAVRIINRFIMFDYGHLFVTTPTVPVLNMRKAENFSNKLKDLFKQKKQLEIELKLIELEEDFTND